jgi:hypothetical protein
MLQFWGSEVSCLLEALGRVVDIEAKGISREGYTAHDTAPIRESERHHPPHACVHSNL